MKILPTVSPKLIPTVLIGAAVIIGGLGVIQMQIDNKPEPVAPTAAGSAAIQRAADRLTQPGLYVAKAVPYSRLGGEEFKDLKASIGTARLPIRIAILPGSITREGRLKAVDLTKVLHREVGKPGVYAVLVDDGGIGRLAAESWPTKAAAADPDATQEVEKAVAEGVQDANDCCARDYAKGLDTFVERSMQKPNGTLSLIFWALLFVVAVCAVWWRWLRRTGQDLSDDQDAEDEVIDSMSAVLRDEVSELSFRVAALPGGAVNQGAPSGQSDVTGTVHTKGRTTKARQLLAGAESRSIQLAGSRSRSMSDANAIKLAVIVMSTLLPGGPK